MSKSELCIGPRSGPSQPSYLQGLLSNIPMLRRYIEVRVGAEQDADDLLQDTLSKTLTASSEKDLDNPIAYAYTVAKTTVADYWKSKSKEPEPLLDDAISQADVPDEILFRQQRLELIGQALEAMPELRRTIFLRRRIDGMSRDEIAKEFGLSVEAVKKHLTRAMVTLSLHLEKYEKSQLKATAKVGK